MKGRTRLSLSTKVFLGLFLGVAAGVFFGEKVAFLKVAGDAFIQLLQMTVLPYVIASLIAGIGRLTFREAISLAKQCGMLLVFVWAMTISMVLVMPLAFPDWKSASFFSTTLVKGKESFNFLELFIPANPFYSMANNIVPAVILFSIAVGVALIAVEKKQVLLDNLSILIDALTRVTQFVVNLAPLGVFAIAASAAGTMEVEELGRWQVYLVTYLAAWLVLSFWILPVLVTSLTPLSYRDVVGYTRDALVTAFATGNLLIVLPVLAQKSKELLKKIELKTEGADSAVDVIIPTSFTFPNAGTLLTLSFVLFAGWFTDFSVSLAQYPTFALTGFFSFFGSVTVAIPFLLDLMRIPVDTFQLYVVSDVLVSRFGTLLAAMHTLVLALLGACALCGQIALRWGKLLRYAAVAAILTVLTIGGARLLFTYGFEPAYTKYKTFVQMDLVHQPVSATIHEELPPPLASKGLSGKSRLATIRERGSLRVGYFKDSLPLAFVNANSKLVGLDVEMAHLLAKELGVSLEFVLIDRKEIAERLEAGQCDIVMSGFAITTQRAQKMAFSAPYLDMTLAFVVRDHRRNDFASWQSMQELDSPQIVIPDIPYYIAMVRERLPRATLVPASSPREFFRSKEGQFDAFVLSAETGSAWTLVYPAFSVAVPLPDPVAVPVAYPMPRGERELVDFVNTWLELKRKDRTIEQLFKHWILGKETGDKEPRWSVIRNVLHWVE